MFRHEYDFGYRFTRHMTDEQAEILWRFGGFGFDPETGESQPCPGPRGLARFLVPISGSWRDILRRAIRTAGNRRERAALVALLRTLTMRPAGIPLPPPAPLALSPQRRCHRFDPARAP